MSELIQKYEAGPDLLAQGIKGLTPADLQWRPPADAPAEAGKWTIQEVVIHLQDAELAFADRFKRIIATDNPVLQGWNEQDFINHLFYAEQSVEDAVRIVRLTHAQVLRIFKKLPPVAFDRAGTHSERGRQTLTDVLKYATWHVEHHVGFIWSKRKLLGK